MEASANPACPPRASWLIMLLCQFQLASRTALGEASLIPKRLLLSGPPVSKSFWSSLLFFIGLILMLMCVTFSISHLGSLIMSGQSDGHRLLCDKIQVLLFSLPAVVGRQSNSYCSWVVCPVLRAISPAMRGSSPASPEPKLPDSCIVVGSIVATACFPGFQDFFGLP